MGRGPVSADHGAGRPAILPRSNAMSRIRVTLIMAGLVVAMAAVALTSKAQPPGGRGGGARRGRRTGRRPRRTRRPRVWGGPGGPGGNLLTLASNEAVQKELKMTDRQKAQVKKISDESNTRRRACSRSSASRPTWPRTRPPRKPRPRWPTASRSTPPSPLVAQARATP